MAQRGYHSRKIQSVGWGFLLLAGALLVPPRVIAQEESQESSGSALEEIVVTATKRGQSLLQDVPISITAIRGDTLAEAGEMNFNDYFHRIPGVSVNDQGPGDKQYIIRGLQSDGAGTANVLFDEIVVTGEGTGGRGRQPDINTYDLQRIEILRGPQGTTFGSSSLAGTIRLIPNQPDLEAFGGEFVGGLSTTKHSDDMGYRAAGVINVPVVKDSFGIRIAAMKDFKEGYLDHMYDDDVNNQDTESIRGMMRWLINDELTFSAIAMFQDMSTDGRNFYNNSHILLPLSDTLNGQPLPEQYYQAVLNDSLGFDDKADLYNGKLEWAKPFGTFTASISYSDRTTELRRSTDVSSEILFQIPADEHPNYLATNEDREIWSNEIRFASAWEGPVQVLAGLNYQKEDRDWSFSYWFTDVATGHLNQSSYPPGALTVEKREQEERSVFGEVEWSLTERLRITGGLRWYDYEIDSQSEAVTQFLYRPGPGPGPLLEFDDSDTIFKFNIAYDVSDDAMVYAQFAEGYRSGGANDESPESIPGIGIDIPSGYASDSLKNYELGFKSAWFDRRLTFDAAAYYIDWSDIQIEARATNAQGLSFPYRGNGGQAEVKGLELSMSAYPAEGFSFDAAMTFTDATLSDDLPIPANGRDGDKIPYVPEFTAFLGARYEQPIIEGRFIGFVGGDWSYTGDTMNRFESAVDAFKRELEAYSILNLRIGIESRDGWEAVLGVDNVLDADDVISYSFDFTFPPVPGVRFLPDNNVRPWPRQLTLSFRKEFY